jgi:hypothetical protein
MSYKKWRIKHKMSEESIFILFAVSSIVIGAIALYFYGKEVSSGSSSNSSSSEEKDKKQKK